MKLNTVVCGGTFDHFHKGHEKFLNYTLSLDGKLIIGLTSDEYVKKLKIKNEKLKIIEDFEKRRQTVLNFLKRKQVLNKVEIIEINDLFGLTLDKDLPIDAIVVSEETKEGAGIINRKRKELGLISLEILIVPAVYAEDGKLISSTRIRKGEINKMGQLYVRPSWFKTDLILPESLREEFRRPFGRLLDNMEDLTKIKGPLIITVGDETVKKFNENSTKQDLPVVDFKIARKERFFSFLELGFSGREKIITASNPAGHITSDLFDAVSKILKSDFNEIILKVKGEEDLTVLPLILLAPLGAIIYYGQYNKGLMEVIVSQESKDKAYNLVSKLKSA